MADEDINFEELELGFQDDEDGPLQDAYGQIEEYAVPEYAASYDQMAHSVSGAGGFYTGGDRMMHAIHTSTYGKKAAFYSKMPNELRNIFGVESGLVNEYMDLFTGIPRYWIRNPKLLIATVELGKHLHGELTSRTLHSVAVSQNVLPADLYRYYKLFKDAGLFK